MAWETRGGKAFYYRVRRVDGRVRKQYVGPGRRGKQAEQEDLDARRKRREERDELQALCESLAPAESLMRDLERRVRQLVHGTLLASGYHQHRGAWRRRHGR